MTLLPLTPEQNNILCEMAKYAIEHCDVSISNSPECLSTPCLSFNNVIPLKFPDGIT